MGGPNLKREDFDLAFTFSRSEAASWRDRDGATQTAAIDVPRFDYGAAGVSLGLLVTGGADFGGGDRAAIDPLILPVEVLEAECTVLHAFTPPGCPLQRYAIYSRNPEATINALMRQHGHHAQISVVAGFLRNIDGDVIYKGFRWRAPGVFSDGAGNALSDGSDEIGGRPLIVAGVATP